MPTMTTVANRILHLFIQSYGPRYGWTEAQTRAALEEYKKGRGDPYLEPVFRHLIQAEKELLSGDIPL